MVYTDNFTPTTTTSTSPCSEPDDISAFLRHLSHRSSATSTCLPSLFHPSLHFPTVIPTHAGHNNYNQINNNNNNTTIPLTCSLSSPVFPPTAVFSGSDRVTSTATDGYFPVSGGSHLSSNIDYADYCDYESEEGAEGAATDEQQSLSRNQSKRTRAAEVHNLSEKRRRSRINEKMKALQNLIPNSNKTDKASMLDEAIEYLKQLQLQVQMLSMRNGMSLHPMCLPEDQGITSATQLSQIGMHNLNNNRSASFDHISITNALNIIPEFNVVNQSSSSTIPTLPSHSNVNKSKMTEFTLNQDSFVPRQYPPSGCTGVAATLPHSFVAGNSNIERHNTLEPQSQTYYGSGSQGMVVQQQRDSSIFSGKFECSKRQAHDREMSQAGAN